MSHYKDRACTWLEECALDFEKSCDGIQPEDARDNVYRAALDEIARLQAVVDAARDVVRRRGEAKHEVDGEIDYLDDAIRALDGEVKP